MHLFFCLFSLSLCVGELNDHLLPVGKETILEASNIQGELEEDDVDNDGRPGTIQRRQYYEKAVSQGLISLDQF